MRRSLILAAVVLMLGGVGELLVVGRASAGDAPPSAPPAPVAPAPKADLPRQTIDLGGGVTFDMVLIPAGEFDMGSPETEEGRYDDETLHRVRITKPYWLARTEVTQAAWEAVMESNPSTTKGPTLPVTYVSWDDCQAFAKRLNERVAGGGFRLPTEAEWEYACRARTTTRYWAGDTEADLARVGWYSGNSGSRTHTAGEKPASPWGLFDMHGNVWEWCVDEYADYPSGAVTDPTGASGSGVRVFRGGGWGDAARLARSANRLRLYPGCGCDFLGLRLARAVTADAPPPPAPGSAPPAQPPAPKPVDPAPPVAPPAKEGEVPSWAKVAPEQVEAARKAGVPVAFENSIGMRFVLIPAGTFTMGSPETEEGHVANEVPHPVTLTKPCYVGVTEVTNAQYLRFKRDHGSERYKRWGLSAGDQPVVKVSWDDATAFVGWLNGQDRGRGYRLPTEAEWEHACRAGSTTRFCFGDDETTLTGYAWYRANSETATHLVGSLKPNAWGLFDMHGNAEEWCADWYGKYPESRATDPAGPFDGKYRVLRGGAWLDLPRTLRSAHRLRATPGTLLDSLGFRVAASIAPK